jgi:hypothetical protein
MAVSMRFCRRLSSAALFALAITVAPACASTARVYVRTGPPAPIVEVRGAAPARGYVWIGGYHRWDGGRYLWVPGRWVAPPRARAVWVPERWHHDRHGWYFVAGHWRR